MKGGYRRGASMHLRLLVPTLALLAGTPVAAQGADLATGAALGAVGGLGGAALAAVPLMIVDDIGLGAIFLIIGAPTLGAGIAGLAVMAAHPTASARDAANACLCVMAPLSGNPFMATGVCASAVQRPWPVVTPAATAALSVGGGFLFAVLTQQWLEGPDGFALGAMAGATIGGAIGGVLSALMDGALDETPAASDDAGPPGSFQAPGSTDMAPRREENPE